MERVYNFSPGPSTISEIVLEKAAKEFVCYGDKGMSVIEMSHRSGMYLEIFNRAKELLKKLMNIPDNYEILFLQGGATLQFAGIPLNLLRKGRADYVDSGNFAHAAAEEAKKYGDIHIAASSREDNYTYVPETFDFRDDVDYAYITTNNTIYGTRFVELPKVNVSLVADMSSNILSQPYDVNDFGVIYAGAQKNIGPAGICVLIIRKDLLGGALPICPKLINWELQVKEDSMLATPNTFAIYMAMLGFEWLLDKGGVDAIYEVNKMKAAMLYQALDESKLFKPTAQPKFRSLMNATFVTGSKELDSAFVEFAAKRGLVNLKGHRSVGGMRASIYNAMPVEGVQKLIEALREFEKENI